MFIFFLSIGKISQDARTPAMSTLGCQTVIYGIFLLRLLDLPDGVLVIDCSGSSEHLWCQLEIPKQGG